MYECVKKIDDYWLMMNDLLGIELIFFYDGSRILQLSEFVSTLCFSVWVVYNNFLLIDATNKSKISINHHRIFFDVNLYPLSFFANTSFNITWIYDNSPSNWEGRDNSVHVKYRLCHQNKIHIFTLTKSYNIMPKKNSFESCVNPTHHSSLSKEYLFSIILKCRVLCLTTIKISFNY